MTRAKAAPQQAPAQPRARLTLGHSDIDIFPIGLGCMGMSQYYGTADPDESVATIHAALDAGIDFLDTSDIYGAAGAVTGQAQAGFGRRCSP